MSEAAHPLVLIVEDDPGVATLQRRRLERTGFRVRVAADVDSAMRALTDGGVQVVVLDYRLGTTTGLDLHRRMQASGFPIPVILVSGAADESLIAEAMRSGVRDVLFKTPDYLDQLPDSVRAVLRQAAAVPGHPPQHGDVRVLIVEDDIGTATLERRHLERSGYTVEVAHTPAEALALVRTGRITLALLDLRLEGNATGIDLYEAMKREGWAIPAVLVTAFPDQSTAIRALRSGIRDFIPKVGDFFDHLPEAVDRVVAQVQVERKLVESELRLASIIGTTMDAIVMCNADGRIVLFNRSAEEMFGCSAAHAIGTNLAEWVPDFNLDASAEPVEGTTLSRRAEVDAIRRDQRRLPIEVSVSGVEVHGRRLFTVIARDISERRRIEAQLRETDRRKDEFLGMLAHELRNPLAAVMNAAEVLHRIHPDPAAQKPTDVIRRQARALARMVDDLLDVSRVTLGKIRITREALLAGEVVARSVEHARAAIEKAGLVVTLDLPEQPAWIRGDATRLEQVLANLLSNAVKFTPAGGRIDVRLSLDPTHATVSVKDTGMGISPELLPGIFDLFVQGDTSLDRAKSGLGIGLSLVRQIVALHGGEVAARSEGPGHGAEFLVRLPLEPAVGAQDEVRAV